MTTKMGRRAVLAGIGMAGASSLVAKTLPSDPDVVIVGAGAAGMAAGHELARRGISFVIVEAGNRVGGRAHTESRSFGQPVDHGCSWISGANRNAFFDMAKEKNFGLVEHTNAGMTLFDLDGNPASRAEHTAHDKALTALDRALNKAGRRGQDVAASKVAPDMPYMATVATWLANMDYGVDFDQLSALDYYNGDYDQPSYFVKEGLGTVVVQLAKGLPISLETPVTEIDWSANGVKVATSKGTISAKACLLTVSTGVLNAGNIRFSPALPARKQQAVSDMPMALLMKVPLLFDGARLGLPENDFVTYRIPEDRPGEACFFVAWPCGHDYIFGNIGGSFAWELYAEGQDAVVDYALNALVRLVGSDARKHFKKGLATAWADDPLTLGAYSAARLGASDAGEILAEPIDERLFFAGEATGGSISALVNGAYESGRRAAAEIADTLT